MRTERGQATVEWIGIVLLIALAFGALTRFVPAGEPPALGSTLAHAITCPAGDDCTSPSRGPLEGGIPSTIHAGHGPPERQGPARALTAPLLVPPVRPSPPTPSRGSLRLPRARALLDWARREVGRLPAQRGTRAVGRAWKHAWFACLVYERVRWAFLHPESRNPGYTFPPEEALRIANDCISPFDFVRDAPLLEP